MDIEWSDAFTIMAISLYQFIMPICIMLIMVTKYGVSGRAILVEPPHRSSLWRFQYNTTINAKDDALNCGGYDWQWRVNRGRCGVCGDRYGDVEEHNDNGKFASGIIVRKYKDGYYINITFEVSSNYLGYVEFRLCPRNHTAIPLTQSCFDRYPLWIDEAHGTRYYIGSRGGIYDIHIRLPGGVVCRKCVLQWKYKTGYRYNGEDSCKCLGCGQQEQYINCADIEVYPRAGWPAEQAIVSPGHPHVFHELPRFTPSPTSTITSDTSPSVIDIIPAKPKQEVVTPAWDVPESIFFALRRRFEMTTPMTTHVEKTTKTLPVVTSQIERTPVSDIIRDGIATPPSVVFPTIKPLNIVNISEGQENLTFLANGEKIVFTVPKIGKLNDSSLAIKPIELGTTPRTFPLRHSTLPNTQFVSVSNILLRFFPEYTPPFMFPLRRKGLGSVRLPIGCDVNSDEFRCVARGIYNQSPGVNKWCEINCKVNNCPLFMCDCACEERFSPRISRCRAVNKFRGVEGMDQWCAANCKVGYCPPEMCSIPHCINLNGEL